MTKLVELARLSIITQTKYDQQQLSFRKIVIEENALRAELDRLDSAARKAQSEPSSTDSMRAIGADILWKGWVARAKTELNLRLAQVMAIKLHYLAEVQKAYGKVLVVEDLKTQAQREAAALKARKALEQAIDQSIF